MIIHKEYPLKRTKPSQKLMCGDIEYVIDKIKKVDYNDIRKEKLIKHLLIMGSTSEKERNKIAKGDEELMTISKYGSDFMNDKETLEYFNTEKTKRLMYRDIYTEEGKAIGEQNRNIEIARNMLKKMPTLSIDVISKITGLSEEKINTLKRA